MQCITMVHMFRCGATAARQIAWHSQQAMAFDTPIALDVYYAQERASKQQQALYEGVAALSIPISAVVLTRNEEEHLPDCLASLVWADEVLVVDSFSTDRTMEIARRLATRAIQHPFQNFAAQRNFAQQQSRHDWVLFVDADERASPELRDEICDLARSGHLADCNAYHIQRVHLFSGRWMPDPARRRVTPTLRQAIRRAEMVRLLDRRRTVWERAVHEDVRVPAPRGALTGVLYHYSATNLSRIYEPLNHYSDLEAALLHRSRRRVSLFEAIARGGRAFAYHYIVRRLFLQGDQGFLKASMYGFFKFLTYAKLSERIRIAEGRGVWTEQDRRLLQSINTEHHPTADEPQNQASTAERVTEV